MLANKILPFILISLIASNAFTEENTGLSPENTIVKFHNSLLNIMKSSSTLGYPGRYQEMSAIVPGIFNIPLISKIILGRYWNELDNEQQSNFITLYTKLVVSTYADRFNSFDNEVFKTLSTETLNRGRLLLKTQLIKGDGEIITLDYLMSESENKWMIISVIANGANDISIKRGEYSDVIKNDGYDSLLTEIQKKISAASD